MANVVPPTNTVGLWKVKQPYSVNPAITYTLIAIREFADIVNLGKDVYETFYKPFNLKDNEDIPGLPETFSFQREIENKVVILTLKSDNGVVLHIPSSFIIEYPDTSVLIYRPLIISLNLGLFNPDTDYSILAQVLEETCKTFTGVDTVTTAAHAAPSTGGLTLEQVNSIERARKNKLLTTETNIEKVIRLEKENEDLRGTIEALTKVLEANNLINN